MAAPVGLCGLCGGDDLHAGDDGFFYCTACGSQSQQFQEQALDFDTQFVGAIKRSNRPHDAQHPLSQPLHGYGAQPFSHHPPLFALTQESEALDDEKLRDALASNIRECYLEGLQKILQLQCEAAVEKFGVSPLVCGYVGPIWLRFVAFTRICEKEWASEAIEVEEARKDRRLIKKRRSQDQKDNNTLSGHLCLAKKASQKKQSSGELRTCHGTKARLVWLAALKERLPLAVTLAILFLACHMAQEPVLPTDIVKWCLEGTLPFLTAYCKVVECRRNASMPLPMDPTLMFKPTNPISAKKLEFMAASIASRVGLQLPAVNFRAISSRFLRQLQLSVEQHSVYVSRFADWYTPPGSWLSDRIGALPSRVYVMAMVVIVLKVLYRIHGQGHWERSLESCRDLDKRSIFHSVKKKIDNYSQGYFCSGAQVVTEQVKFASPEEEHSRNASSKRLLHYGLQNLVYNEAVKEKDSNWRESENVASYIWDGQMLLEHLERCRLEDKSHHFDYEQDLPTYLKYCRDTIFSGAKMETEERNLCDHLSMLYEKLHEEDSKVNITKNLPCNIDEGATKLHTSSAHEVDGESGSSCMHLKGGYKDPSKHHADFISPGYPIGNSREKKETIPESRILIRGLTHEREAELLQIIHEIEESGFLYLPPRQKPVPPDGYIKYIRQDARDGVIPEFVHADYFILLRTCAKVVNVHPKALHRCIQKLESGLKQIEKRIEPVSDSEKKSKDE